MKKIDEVFSWRGFGNGFGKWESSCRIRAYEAEECFVVIATEIEENMGTPIASCCEFLMPLVLGKLGMPAERCVWIEHHQRDKFLDKGDVFAVVRFQRQLHKNPLDPKTVLQTFHNPEWKPLRREHVESLIGEEF